MAIQDDNTILKKADLKAYHERIAPMLGGTFMVSTNNSDYYSTDEKVVGIWTDGKPVYQKTFIISKADFTKVSDYRYEYSISSLNIDKLVKADSVASVGTDGQGVSPGIVFTNTSINNSWNYGVLVIRSKIIMSLQADVISNGGFSSVTTTIRYTKTTDSAGSALTTPGAYDINFPNTWPVNQEIFFGNGLYGKRWTGTYTGQNTTFEVYLDTTLKKGDVSSVVSMGGSVNRANGGATQTLNWNNSATMHVLAVSTNGVYLQLKENNTTAGHKYDVWMTYTK